jgi:hypothetical protein
MPSENLTDDSSDLDADPTATFSLLADETRLGLVRELAAADGPVGFADLYSRVGLSDTGRFNYHLGKLRGTMVEKTAGSGYVLTDAGEHVLDVVADTPNH